VYEKRVQREVDQEHPKWPVLKKLSSSTSTVTTTSLFFPIRAAYLPLVLFESDHLPDLFIVGLFQARERKPLAQYLLLLI